MTGFIAVQKKKALDPNTVLTALSIDRQRSLALKATQSAEKAELLKRIGLTEIEPTTKAPSVYHSFQRLDYVKAYVVGTPNRAVAERARELLEPDYLIVPDLQLSLPAPLQKQRYLQRPLHTNQWPEISGIALAHANDIRGQGVLMGVLDTGCDADHIEVRRKLIDFAYVPFDPVADGVRCCRGFDVDGHGTHVCGILAGQHLGIAPAVDLMVASVIESETLRTSLDRVLIALNWMLAKFQLEENLNKPTIINLSLGFRPEWVHQAQLLSALQGIQQILKTLVEDYAVLPIVAIGNDGPQQMRAPAYFQETLSVGAVDWSLQPAAFSGGGLSPLTLEVEPDVAGFGVDVVSSYERTVAGRNVYAKMSGTSMAAPYVAGIAALAAAADPQRQGANLRKYLIETVLKLDASPDRVGVGLARFV